MTLTRENIWRFCRRGIPEGQMLPRWALTIRMMLFPIQAFYWLRHRGQGYDILRDAWRIGGVEYAGSALASLASAQGQLFRISRVGDTVIFVEVDRE